jgi:hypothetical protein
LKILHEETSSDPSEWDSCIDATTAADGGAAATAAAAAHARLEKHLNFSLGQGHSGQLAFLTLTLAVLSRDAATMCQTGFNSGHSAVTALEGNPAIKVLSFDLGEEAVVAAAASYIEAHDSYRGRHELILGDSRDTVVAAAASRERLCDISFVDGGHFGDVPLSDILSLGLMSHEDTLLIVDDTPFLRDVEAAWCSLPPHARLPQHRHRWRANQWAYLRSIMNVCDRPTQVSGDAQSVCAGVGLLEGVSARHEVQLCCCGSASCAAYCLPAGLLVQLQASGAPFPSHSKFLHRQVSVKSIQMLMLSPPSIYFDNSGAGTRSWACALRKITSSELPPISSHTAPSCICELEASIYADDS